MDIHYNAFISYRHHPDDIRVATQIHRALERYHIPKAVRKNQKGALRLFRDKDELPITSNLSDNITLALENSDFLIVICSTHTKESVWVQREIETFLKTHSHDKVLTVLVDGEPYDTIPEILQYRDEVDPQTGAITRVPVEPLSCDWRVGRKAAYREELPRLAAVLLRCSYDELRQRQRQYKLRRLMAVLSGTMIASLCLMGYFLYTSIVIRQANVQIQANLDAALKNQSRYLSAEASERYLAGDRLTAIAFALAALPDGENDRPYVPEAELTLTDALGIYDPYRGVTASGIIECGALVDAFAVSDDGKNLYAVDRNGRITFWNANTYTQLASVDLKTSDCRKMQVVGENLMIQLYVEYGSGEPELCCYSPQGEMLWSVENCDDFAVLGDETLMVMDNSQLSGEMILSFLDPASGSKQREDVSVQSVSGEKALGFFQEHYASGSVVTLDFQSYDEDFVYMFDPKTDTVEVIEPYSHWDPEQKASLRINAVSATDQGDVLVMVSDNSGIMNGEYSNMVTTSPANAEVLCFRGEEWALAWRQQISSYSYSALITMQTIPGTNSILCQKDNVFYVLDSDSGQILSRCEAQANVCAIYVAEDRASGVLKNGSYFLYKYAENECYAMQLMDADLLQAEMVGVYYTLTDNSTHITKYDIAQETHWTPYKENMEGYVRWELFCDKLLITLSSDGKLRAIDMQTDRCLWTSAVSNAYSVSPLGFSADGKELYVKETDGILAFAMSSGEARTMVIPKSVDGQEASSCGFGYGSQNRFFYMLRLENDLYFAVMDLQTGEAEVHTFAKDVAGNSWEIGNNSGVVAANADYAWVWNEGTLYEIALRNGACRPILTELTEYPMCTYHETETLLSVGVGNEVAFFQPGGGEIMRVSMGEQKAISLCFHGGELLAVSNEGKLHRFSTDGTRLSQTALQIYTSFYTNCIPAEGKQIDIGWDFTDKGDLILNVFGMGNIVDCTQWEVRAYVPQYKGYDAQQDRLVCYIESQYGYFPRYTTAQVMQIAREQLNGYTLSDELKADYGIG